MNFFIFDAIASVDSSSQSSPYSLVVMLIIFVLFFYFMILRPQQKRVKIHKELMRSISKGDEVLTTGGLIGRVIKITDTDYISIALNESNIVIVKRDFVTAVLPKGTMSSL